MEQTGSAIWENFGISEDKYYRFLQEHNISFQIANRPIKKQEWVDADGKRIPIRKIWQKFLFINGREDRMEELLEFYQGDHAKALNALDKAREFLDERPNSDILCDAIDETIQALAKDFARKYLVWGKVKED